MTANWVRRSYDAVGVTQSPPGRHLRVLQEPYVGKVLLCIDVSGSMYSRLGEAVTGASHFVSEAIEAHYRVGLVLWHHGVEAYVPVSDDRRQLDQVMHAARSGGGNNIVPTLDIGIRDLGPLAGDRVMAIFGDGDVGDVQNAVQAAGRAAELGIRIVVRGLGEHAHAQLNQIATDRDEASVVRSETDISAGIASMASSITIRRS